jgi:hypothetical protein
MDKAESSGKNSFTKFIQSRKSKISAINGKHLQREAYVTVQVIRIDPKVEMVSMVSRLKETVNGFVQYQFPVEFMN